MERGKSADYSGAGDDAWVEVKGKRKGKEKSADSGAGAGVPNSSSTTSRYNHGLNYLAAVQNSSSTTSAAVAGAAGNLDEYRLSLCKNHSNYLIRDSDNNGLNVESLDDYFSQSPIPIVQSYEVLSEHESERLGYTYVPEVHTAHFRAMVRYLCHIHDLGVSVKRLDESNLVVQGGKLKFRRLEFVNLVGKEDGHKRLAFEHLHHIIKNMIEKHNRNNCNFPTLFNDLLADMMQNYSYVDELLRNHLALQSHALRVESIKNFFENSSYIPGNHRIIYDTEVIGQMSSPWKDWTERFNGSDLRVVGPVKDCFDYESKKKQKYEGTGSPQVVNRHILRCSRNMAVHLPQHLQRYTNSQVGVMDVDLTIMALFEHELLSFQKLAEIVIAIFVEWPDDEF
ncbi:hypothetical protein C2S52_023384 [Perilla frutescens var. hirtella]|nr:hypothetical protein C2S52_023384 [Perilla frutescens var. hirtella]